MDRKISELMIWRLRRAAHRLSWPAALALAIFALDIALYFSTVMPAAHELRQLRAEASRRAASVDRWPDGQSPRPVLARSAHQDLEVFYATLAQPAGVPDILGRLHNVAVAQGLVLTQTEYRSATNPGGKLTRYQIDLPAKGTYPEMRRFLAQAGREIPGLALDGMSFERREIRDEVLDVRFKFTLFIGT